VTIVIGFDCCPPPSPYRRDPAPFPAVMHGRGVRGGGDKGREHPVRAHPTLLAPARRLNKEQVEKLDVPSSPPVNGMGRKRAAQCDVAGTVPCSDGFAPVGRRSPPLSASASPGWLPRGAPRARMGQL